MGAIENLEILVEIDISEAIAALEDLEDELRELSRQIDRVDRRGTEGIDIRTSVDSIDDDLTVLSSKIESWEAANEINIDTDVDSAGLGARTLSSRVMSAGDLGGGGGGGFDDMLAAFAEAAPMDFGGFNVPRGRGIGDDDDADLGRKLRRLADSISDSLSEMTDFRLRMSDMHNAMATLIPALLVFIGIIPTAVAALATLATAAVTAAGALLGVAGLGLMGAAGDGGKPSMQEMQDELMKIMDSFWEAFAPLAERLAPVFEDGLDGLEKFFEAIAQEGDALMTLVDDLEDFGGFVMDFFPQMLRVLSGVVEAMGPIFGAIGDFLKENFEPIMRDLVRITLEAAPALGKLAIQMGQMAMFLAELGVGFARVASMALSVLGVVGNLLGIFGITNEQLGVLIGSLLLFATTLALANTRLVQFALKGIMLAIIGIYNFWVGLLAADSALTYLAGTTIISAISSFASFVVSVLFGSKSLLALASSAFTATGAVAALMTVLTLGAAVALVGVAMSIAGSFMSMAGSIDSATSSLKDFNRVAGKTEGTDFNPYGGDDPAGMRSGASGSVRSGGGTTINYESTGDSEQDNSNLDKTVWRANRTTGDT